MQLQSDLTLEKAIAKACQADEIIQQIVVRGNENPTNGNGEVDRIYKQGTSRRGRETMKTRRTNKRRHNDQEMQQMRSYTTACIRSMPSETSRVQQL